MASAGCLAVEHARHTTTSREHAARQLMLSPKPTTRCGRRRMRPWPVLPRKRPQWSLTSPWPSLA
eukprot:3509012-Rhodomonas_salina.1